MFLFSILFLLGILIVQLFQNLPSQFFLLSIILFFIAHYLFFKKYSRYTKFILPIIIGFSWALWYSHAQLSWVLPDSEEGKPLQVTGMIITIPDRELQRTSFRFLIKKIQSSVKEELSL